jgi:hypothetical protein
MVCGRPARLLQEKIMTPEPSVVSTAVPPWKLNLERAHEILSGLSQQPLLTKMKTRGGLIVLTTLVFTGMALPSRAADRIHAGLWVGTTIVNGKTYPTSSCVSQSDADAMNGDVNAVTVFLQKAIPPEICRISDVRIDSIQVIYTVSCGAAAPKVVTTSYHGDSSAGTDSTGSKTEAKLTGACK